MKATDLTQKELAEKYLRKLENADEREIKEKGLSGVPSDKVYLIPQSHRRDCLSMVSKKIPATFLFFSHTLNQWYPERYLRQ